MQRTNLQVIVGLVAACLVVPVLFDVSGLLVMPDAGSQLSWHTVTFGIPAAFLLIGYQIASRSKSYSAGAFARGGAVTGIVMGLIIIVPLAAPLIYFRAEHQTALEQFVKLLAVFTVVSTICTGCAYIFWLLGIKPPTQKVTRA